VKTSNGGCGQVPDGFSSICGRVFCVNVVTLVIISFYLVQHVCNMYSHRFMLNKTLEGLVANIVL
jgi:hypothetical protein